jgi:aminoglycoside 3-N-acetyltransferase
VSLVDDLRALGVGAGDRVVVHSSLRAVRHGAAEMADALLEAVGPSGLVVVPTFTYDAPSFDAATTAARTGALPEELRRRPAAVRSQHHSHSVAAIGAGSADLCAGHELLAATDLDSPLDRLAGSGGLVLLLGVGHTSNTTVHVGESHAHAAYLGIPFSPAWPTGGDIRFAGCSRAFGTVERGLRKCGAIRDGRVGHALAQVMPGSVVIEETVRLLDSDPTALLCTDEACYRCSAARML